MKSLAQMRPADRWHRLEELYRSIKPVADLFPKDVDVLGNKPAISYRKCLVPVLPGRIRFARICRVASSIRDEVPVVLFPCQTCIYFAHALELEFVSSGLAEQRDAESQEEYSVQAPAGGKGMDEGRLTKVHDILAKVAKAEKEAIAADILDAACVRMEGHSVQSLCHGVVEQNEEALKHHLISTAAAMGKTPADIVGKKNLWGVAGARGLCLDVLKVCSEEHLQNGAWEIKPTMPIGAWIATLALLLAGCVFVSKPWPLLMGLIA